MSEQVTRKIDVRIQIRNDTAYNWNQVNPIPMKGEMCVEIDSGLFKFGNGISTYRELQYSASPSIILTTPPTATDYKYLVGTMAIVDNDKVWILISNAENAAVWKRILTVEDIEDLGVGDMLKEQYATNDKSADGYVDKAIRADRLSQARSITVDGDLVTANVYFDGTQNVVLNAALVDIMDLAGGGTFVKVIVDSKGRVVGYEALVPSDIPNLTLSKITDAGTAAGKNVGTAIGQVVMVEDDGKIDPSLMPSITITDVFVAASEAEMLALNADQGDFVIRTDTSETYILAKDPNELGNWVLIKNPLNGIQQINGKVGPNVTLTTDDIAEGEDNLYYTDDRVLDIMSQQATTMFTDGATIVHDVDILILDGGNAGLT